MKLWLSRFRNGEFALSALKPRKFKLLGTELEDFYFRGGDPVGHRYMCPMATLKIFGNDERLKNMKPLDDPIRVEMRGTIITPDDGAG